MRHRHPRPAELEDEEPKALWDAASFGDPAREWPLNYLLLDLRGSRLRFPLTVLREKNVGVPMNLVRFVLGFFCDSVGELGLPRTS